MGQLLGQFQSGTRLPPAHVRGCVLVRASVEEGAGQSYRLVVEAEGDGRGQQAVWLERGGTEMAPVQTRRGKNGR